jgi:invasion protein IalB
MASRFEFNAASICDSANRNLAMIDRVFPYVIRAILTIGMVVLSLGTSAPLPACAQQETISTTTFDNWVFSCNTRVDKDNKTAKSCEVRTTLLLHNQQSDKQEVVAVIAIGRTAIGAPLMAVAQVPLNVALNVPVKLIGANANKSIAEFTFEACQPQACRATTSLSTAQLAALQTVGDQFYLNYNNQSGQTLKISTATKGLTQALGALDREK